jgi:hypothetical protein
VGGAKCVQNRYPPQHAWCETCVGVRFGSEATQSADVEEVGFAPQAIVSHRIDMTDMGPEADWQVVAVPHRRAGNARGDGAMAQLAAATSSDLRIGRDQLMAIRRSTSIGTLRLPP